jgi:hypothetical protein
MNLATREEEIDRSGLAPSCDAAGSESSDRSTPIALGNDRFLPMTIAGLTDSGMATTEGQPSAPKPGLGDLEKELVCSVRRIFPE